MSTHTDVIADLADAIDPRLKRHQRYEAARRAAKAKPLFALVALSGFTNGMLKGLIEAGADGSKVMADIRKEFARVAAELGP